MMRRRVANLAAQIEGFKLHVAHITKPFVTRVRHTPEVASKPDRLVKDLENAKKLAALLEEEYMNLRRAKVDEKSQNGDASTGANGVKSEPLNEDAPMREATTEAEEDPEPREMGSEAVERRIEKVMADLQEQGAVDTSDEKALEAKRVRLTVSVMLVPTDHVRRR